MPIGPPVQTAPRALCSVTDPSRDARTPILAEPCSSIAMPVTGKHGEIHNEPAREAQGSARPPGEVIHHDMAKGL
jgi:hypothetical protein